MQTKVIVAAAAVAGLLVGVTLGSPVMAQAARLIGGHDIKDGSITGVDVRNHSLRARDFKAGSLPRGPQGEQGPQGDPGPSGVVAAEFRAGAAIEPSGTLAFVAAPVSVTVGAGEAVVVSSSAALGSTGGAADLDLDVCYDTGNGIAVGLGAGVSDLTATGLQLFSLSAVLDGLPADTYDVGLCGSTTDNDWDRAGQSYTTAQVVTLPTP